MWLIHWKYCEPFQAYLGIQTSSQSCQKKKKKKRALVLKCLEHQRTTGLGQIIKGQNC